MKTALQRGIEWIDSPQISEKMDLVAREVVQTFGSYTTKEMRYNVLSGILRELAVGTFQEAYLTGLAQASVNFHRAQFDDHSNFL